MSGQYTILRATDRQSDVFADGTSRMVWSEQENMRDMRDISGECEHKPGNIRDKGYPKPQ